MRVPNDQGRWQGDRRWRLLVHAMDRTGPPVLTLTFLKWLRAHRPMDLVEVVAFRGGPLAAAAEDLAPLAIVLDDEEPWNPNDLAPERLEELRGVLSIARTGRCSCS